MPRPVVDIDALAAAVDQQRDTRKMSWRAVAQELELSPSTLTRLRNGYAPDTAALIALTAWLGMTVEDFTRERTPSEQKELTAELAPLLRARSDLDSHDIEMLEQIIGAAYKQIQQRHKASG